MKIARRLVIIMAMLVFLPLSIAWTWDDWEHHKPKPVTYTSPNQFAVDFWMEKFQGGGPGQQGNVLFASRPGFIFQNALLSNLDTGEAPQYTTTYIGGKLILSSPGPWAKYGKLIAIGITAKNVSTQDPTSGKLTYELTFSDQFDNDRDLCFSVTADYKGTPKVVPAGNSGIPLLQMSDVQPDTGFKATITLKDCGW